MGRQHWVATLMALACAYAHSALAGGLDRQIQFNIPPQPLSAALIQFSSQADVQVITKADDVSAGKTGGVNGLMSASAALQRLLEGTGFSYLTVGDNTVEIATGAVESDSASADSMGRETVRLAQTEPSTSISQEKAVDATPAEPESENGKLEEIVVSAQKRVERLQDVPVPVTAIAGETFLNSHQLRLEEYYTKVPGLSLVLTGPEAGPSVSIRGLGISGSTNPTVGIMVDEVPYGSTITIGNTLTVADVDPGDLARVEVLRGPQGTLYGASSIGGLLKFATIDPSTAGVNGRLHLGTSSVKNGDGLGYEIRGAINVPLGDTFAVRASGFDQHDAGYIDNIQAGEDGVNRRKTSGGRLAAQWSPSDTVSLKMSALIQDIDRHGSADVHVQPGVGDLQQRSVPQTGGYGRKTQAYGATLKAQFGSAGLTAASGYSIDKTNSAQDDSTTTFGARSNALFGFAGAANFFDRTVEKFTQEVRLAMPLGEKFEWLIGAFYTDEKVGAAADFWGLNPATGERVGRLIKIDTPDNRFEEVAAFTDLTVNFTERFNVQFGGRVSRNKQSFFTVRSGPLVPVFFPGQPTTTATSNAKDSPFTYLVTPQFKVSSDLMVYARLASGYRPGAPNVNCGLAGIPCDSDSDTTQNYEIGIKGSALERKLSFDASLYSIDWKDIQLIITNSGGFSYIANAGRASSQGVELSLEARPVKGLTVAAWAVLSDAELAEDFPPGPSFGRDGDPLPFSSRRSASLSVDQEFPVSSATGFLGVSASYVGDRVGVFRGVSAGLPLPRQSYPAYTQVDVRAGASFDTWTINAFVNNVADKRALLGGGVDNFIPFAFNYNQPRTIGMSLSKIF